jgi:hypothetical protein
LFLSRQNFWTRKLHICGGFLQRVMVLLCLCWKQIYLRYLFRCLVAPSSYEFAGRTCRAARLFSGGPVVSFISAARSVIVADHKGARKWSAKVAEHRTKFFAVAA